MDEPKHDRSENDPADDPKMDKAMMQRAKEALDCIQADYYSCEEAVKRLNEYLDHEMSGAERDVVLKHLEICRPCLRRFTFEKTLVVSLRQKVTLLCAPTALREKLYVLLRDHE